jgi:hypothetical protein
VTASARTPFYLALVKPMSVKTTLQALVRWSDTGRSSRVRSSRQIPHLLLVGHQRPLDGVEHRRLAAPVVAEQQAVAAEPERLVGEVVSSPANPRSITIRE